MSQYEARYKCQLCGQSIRYGNAHEVPYDMLPGLLEKFIQNQGFMGNPVLYNAHMYLAHKCHDGSAGLAVFVGFKKID